MKNIIPKILLFTILVSFSVEAQSEGLNDSTFTMKKSPWGAVLRSAVLPGWGQIYTESYWKAPIIWTAGGFLIYNWKRNVDLYYDARRLYNEGSNIDRNYYHDQRDLFAIYTMLAYVLNLVDAYVDAHLFDFDVSTDNNRNFLNMKIYF